mgnify:FL=1
MYILRLGTRAFISSEENGNITIVSTPEKATRFDNIGDAMRIAAQANEDLETNKVHVFSL